MDIQQEALTLGWRPREQFQGNPDKFVEAEDFVERGKHIMPILRKNNEKLVGTVESLQSEVGTLKQSIASLNESTQELIKFHEESTKAQVSKARTELLAEIKGARAEEDVDAEIAAVGKLSEFDAAQKAVASTTSAATVATPASTAAPVAPEVTAWMKENSWYGVDQVRTGMAIGVATKMRAEGDTRVGTAFLDDVAKEVEEKLGEGDKRTPVSKVEGNRGSGQGRVGGTDYASLPADARAMCDKQAEKFVGTDRVFKTTKEWQAHYAAEYFKGN